MLAPLHNPISIHALLAESDPPLADGAEPHAAISIHALLAESDQYWATRARAAQLFLSTLSLRRATPSLYGLYDTYAFLSTLSLRRATSGDVIIDNGRYISIHALLAESDNRAMKLTLSSKEFLSTLSLRRATMVAPPYNLMIHHFYPRSPCGERLMFVNLRVVDGSISIHALLAESDQRVLVPSVLPKSFLSTLSLRRATKARPKLPKQIGISIHALLAESDCGPQKTKMPSGSFLSTLSLRRATFVMPFFPVFRSYFYPRSPCGERPTQGRADAARMGFLSTLSLRRATARAPPYLDTLVNFYPRSPCGERLDWWRETSEANVFLSTLSLRRATSRWALSSHLWTYFYPRSPCGERLQSIVNSLKLCTFLSTLSLRRATSLQNLCNHVQRISIHALLAESDGACRGAPQSRRHFYPRSPCGERLRMRMLHKTKHSIFLSTLSLRRATAIGRWGTGARDISIHALLAESDCPSGGCHPHVAYFYPRSPCGERRRAHVAAVARCHFYPRSPCGERPAPVRQGLKDRYFYPRSPCGERHQDTIIRA